MIDSTQVLHLAAEAMCNPVTVRRAYGLTVGPKNKPITLERIARAAKQLGYPPPPAQQQPSR